MLSQKYCVLDFASNKDDDTLYHSDSDESLHQYRLSHQPPPLRPQSTLSLNLLCSRRRSSPDIYPGVRRFSTSYSHEDILSNDQLDQIHFDPRYRDYRSASSLNNSNYRSRSNSLNSVGSGGNMMQQYQQFRGISNHSPPLLGAPLVPQKRWDTNPSIFIEEYNDDEHSKLKTESKSEPQSERNSKETLCSSNESLQPLNESDIKSFGDLSQIPFIDEDSNEAAPCRFMEDDCERKSCGIMTSGNQRNTCRKTVSFDVIAGGTSTAHHHLFTNNGKNSPKNPISIPYPTDKNQSFHGSHRCRANVRPSRDGINRNTQSRSSVPRPSSSCVDDHCTLVDKLIRLRLEEEGKLIPERETKPKLSYNIKWDGMEESRVCEGKVKALTTYFNSLPYVNDECNCLNVHQSTPDLSSPRNHNKLTKDEMEIVRKQLKEWSEFGLNKPSNEKPLCSFLEYASSSPKICLENERYSECKQYHDVLNRLDKVEMRRRKMFHHSLENVYNPMTPNCFCLQTHHHCHPNRRVDDEKVVHHRPATMRSEKHRCRSACFNIKDPAKKKKMKERKSQNILPEDDNESFII